MGSKYLFFVLLGGVLTFPLAAQQVDREVLEYVRAIRVQRGRVAYTVDTTISAAIPSLSKTGIFQAIKRHTPFNKPSYEPISFRGDGLIKTDVIARYLNAELDSQKPEEMLAVEISPLNYKFIPKGQNKIGGRDALIYEVKPLRHRSGLFHGTVWVDAQTRLPLMEQGKLEKLPSIWLSEVTFTRTYSLIDGVALPSRINSEAKLKIIGKTTINIEFSNYHVQDQPIALAVAEEQTHH